MTGLKPLTPDDIMAIKDDTVEVRSYWESLTREMVELILKSTKAAYTYFKDDQIVACCGAVKNNGNWEIWAIYSSKFDTITFAKVDAAMAFREKLRHLWITEQNCDKACFSIPSDIKNGAKYAKLLGGKFLRSEDSLLFKGIINDIYEVI